MINRGEKINRSAIYQNFTDKWLQHERWRRALGTPDRLYFCTQLALHFYKTQENSVHWRELPDFIREYFKKRINMPEDIDIFESDARTSNFLVREEQGGQYSFVHKSFMEFFVARHFHDAIQKRIPNGLDDLKDFTRSRVILEFLIELLDTNDIEFLRSDAFYVDKENYLELMTQRQSTTKRIYTNPESVGNCAYLLLKKGLTLDGANLDEAKLSNISLDNVSFLKTSFIGAQFNGGTFVNVNFQGARLSYANFEGAELKNINFAKADLEKANFLNATIDSKTLESLAKSTYWGSLKISPEYKRRIQISYEKPGPLHTIGS
ncbi:MAG: pentapeptide repeat-containing protein [Deltaproteobacteria bacterium]|nr:pentapeptide repeat-containing protein [Deltaproteobacteria bacterium]